MRPGYERENDYERFKIHFYNMPWNDNLALFIRKFDLKERKGYIVKSIEWLEVPECSQAEPTFNIEFGEGNKLLQQLWDTGARPLESKHTIGQIQAMESHLADMRRLVFEEKPNKSFIQPR